MQVDSFEKKAPEAFAQRTHVLKFSRYKIYLSDVVGTALRSTVC